MTRRRTPTVLFTAVALLSGLAIAAGAARASSPNQKSAPARPATNQPAAPAADDATAGVEVTALALEPTKFCKYGSDAYLVYVPIDVTIVNGRRAPIILAKALRVQRALLGKTNDDVQAGRFPLEQSRTCPRCPAFFICGPLPDGPLKKNLG